MRNFTPVFGILLLAACGENEVATEHIRSVVAEAEGPVLTLPNDDTLHVSASVVEFYRDRDYRPAWTDDDEILDRGLSLLEAIGKANGEGLDRERYHYTTAREMALLLAEDAVEEQELEYLGNLDLLLTENFARMSQDLVAGTIDPERAGLEWRIERGEAPDRRLIDAALDGEDPQMVLASIKPRVPYYSRLADALGKFRVIADSGGWDAVPEGGTLSEGDRDPRVAQLRARLSAGDDSTEAALAARGVSDPQLFDPALKEAVAHFQDRHMIDDGGALDARTLKAMNVPVEDRIRTLRLNLDRWRWLPNRLGDTFILVNVAGFELELVHEDSVLESMSVVVGKVANRTPIFRDTLEYMVVNPYWNVPASIAREEILPAAQLDPTYLARNNYEVVRGSVSPAAGGQASIRQRPGPWNALGDVKFLFPNGHNIYLHDTPADHLFERTSRAFSHGCIRVERPDDLARTLLEILTDRDPDEYDRLKARSGEVWVEYDRKIPVYILYFTAWADADGTMRFHPDIYSEDETLGPEQERQLGPVEPRPIRTEGV